MLYCCLFSVQPLVGIRLSTRCLDLCYEIVPDYFAKWFRGRAQRRRFYMLSNAAIIGPQTSQPLPGMRPELIRKAVGVALWIARG
jgi:hypothetical protein